MRCFRGKQASYGAFSAGGGATIKSTRPRLSAKPLAVVLLAAGLLFSFPYALPVLGQGAIELELVKSVADPFGQYRQCSAFVLHGMNADEPQVAAVWYNNGDVTYSSSVAFYDSALNLMGTWAIPDPAQSNPDMVMCITSGDLDGDGKNEIALLGRKYSAGLYVTQWNSQNKQIDNLWSYNLGSIDGYLRGLAIGNFVPDDISPGKEIALGGERASYRLYVLNRAGKKLTQGFAGYEEKTLQAIYVADTDGDGLDEMVMSFGRSPGSVALYEYNQSTNKFGFLWKVDATSGLNVGNNVYEATYLAVGDPTGGPAIAFATERELLPFQGAVGLLDLANYDPARDAAPKILWRYSYPAQARSGGCDFADITADGVAEVISRMNFQNGTSKIVVFDNQGNLLAAPDVDMGITSVGPYAFDYGHDGQMDILASGIPGMNVYRIVALSKPSTTRKGEKEKGEREEKGGQAESAGVNRRGVADERAVPGRNSEPPRPRVMRRRW